MSRLKTSNPIGTSQMPIYHEGSILRSPREPDMLGRQWQRGQRVSHQSQGLTRNVQQIQRQLNMMRFAGSQDVTAGIADLIAVFSFQSISLAEDYILGRMVTNLNAEQSSAYDTWDEHSAYAVSTIVKYTDSGVLHLYRCIVVVAAAVHPATNTVPSSDTDHWERFDNKESTTDTLIARPMWLRWTASEVMGGSTYSYDTPNNSEQSRAANDGTTSYTQYLVPRYIKDTSAQPTVTRLVRAMKVGRTGVWVSGAEIEWEEMHSARAWAREYTAPA